MENKKNKRRRRLLLALLLMLLTGGVLSVGTYAWFTANKQVTVDSIDVNVAASKGLQISADGIDFKSIVSADDLLDVQKEGGSYTTAINQIPRDAAQMQPVSTALEYSTVNPQLIKMFTGSIENGDGNVNILTTAESVETKGETGDFIAFDVFIQSTEKQKVFLTSSSSVVAKEGTTSKGIENAARVLIINKGYKAVGTSAAEIQALNDKPTTPRDAMKLWEPNYDAHTVNGITNAKNVYGPGYNVVTNDQIAATGTPRLTYYGVNDVITTTDSPQYVLNAVPDGTNYTKLSSVTPDIETKADRAQFPATYPELFELQAGINKLRIYMWVEGQDVDCEDNASGSSLTFSLQFSIANDDAGTIPTPTT